MLNDNHLHMAVIFNVDNDFNFGRKKGECRVAMAALIRHIMLKAPDKAESRTIASAATARLLQALTPPEQYQYLTFVAKLSRSAKV